MHSARFTDEQIEDTVRLAYAGTPLAEIVSRLGISEATFFVWKKRIDRLGTREIRQLRDENARLAQLVADLTIHRKMCKSCAREPRPRRREALEIANPPPVQASH